jgi:hypothetical protein|nr:hypothetical protein [Mycolicibacterium phlei]
MSHAMSATRTGPTDSLLRFALRADATLCAAVGLLIATAADPLGRASGLSTTAEWIAGVALVGYGSALYLCAGVPQVRRVGVAVLAGNVAFALGAVVVVAAGWLSLTEFGAVEVLTFAALTLGLAALQYRGVRRLDAAPS